MTKDSTLSTYLSSQFHYRVYFISVLVMEGILVNQIETFLQFFRPLGSKIIIFLFLKKRNGLKGKHEGQHHCLPTPQSMRGEKYSLWPVTWQMT